MLYPNIDQIFPLSAPTINSGYFNLTADVEIPATGADGVLIANGGRFGGSSLFVQNGKLHYAQTDGYTPILISASKPLASGKNKLRVEFAPDSAQHAKVSLFANDEKIGEGEVPLKNNVAYFAYDEGFDVGRDLQSPVNEAYQSPFAFSGNLEKITINYRP